VKNPNRKNSKSASPYTLRQALIVLSGLGMASAGYADNVSAQVASPQQSVSRALVTVDEVKKPKNVVVKTPKTWQRVVIELTPEQKVQLAKAGVQTDQLKITTYNIQKLAGDMIN
jgi:hypothetical protein